MPRYYFHVVHRDGAKTVNEGLELESKEQAWVEATTACGELLRDLDGSLKPGAHWSMLVKDDAGDVLYELEFRTKAMGKAFE
jgi:hypothetical protein